MSTTVRTVPPPLDEPWRRLAWVAPLSIFVWAAVLVCFSFLLEQTAPPPPELKPLQARIVELPPPAGLQRSPAPPTQPKPRLEVKRKAVALPHTRRLQISPETTSSLPTAKNSQPEPPSTSAPDSNTNALKGEGATGTGTGLGNDSAGARAIYAPIPTIPDELREDTYETVAVAHFKVSYEGNVEVFLTTPTSNSRLNQILIDTLERWRFSPATKNGVAIDSEFDVRIPVTVQ
jgi:periplasmic protein TonB